MAGVPSKWIYPNFQEEVTRRKIKTADIAKGIYYDKDCLTKTLRGEMKLKLSMAFAIRDAFFPDMSIEYLFAPEGKAWRGTYNYENSNICSIRDD